MNPSSTTHFNPWPLGILLAFVLFIAGAAVLVFMAASGHSELVAPDYYEQELRYQRRLEQLQRARAWESQIAVEFSATSRQLSLALPPEHATRGARGQVVLYRPAAAGQDRRLALSLDAAGRQNISAEALGAGLWKVQVAWQVGTEEFYTDRSLVIP